MAGVPNTHRPVELLDAVVDYLVKNGVRDLSLRPLARAVGSSPRVLLYHFGSKEGMIDRVLSGVRERQKAAYQKMSPPSFAPPSAGCREIWQDMTSAESEAAFRLFFEVYSLALQDRKRFANFLHSTIEDWLEFTAKPMRREGYGKSESRAFATLVLAGFRGLMLDYCASRDRRRLDRALDLWLRGLDAIFSPPTRLKRRKA
jgi:AcrR family transcriptional regulator